MSRIIETVEDWNHELESCGCCPMPVCPTPLRECEHLYGIVDIEARRQVGSIWYGEFRWDYSSGGYIRFYVTQHFSASWFMGGFTYVAVDVAEYLNEEVPPNFGFLGETLLDPIDKAAAGADGLAALAAAKDWGSDGVLRGEGRCAFGATRQSNDPDLLEGAFNTLEIIVYHRFRWTIPDDFAGSYFKITWDVIEEPEGWDDDDPTVFRTFAAEDVTWEWEGPGDPEDPDSWKSEWYEIDPPPAPIFGKGFTRKIVNIRYECYRSTRFGSKPQIIGDAVTLPD
jgi:hypothetical protein